MSDDLSFLECASCIAKPGSPYLCASCLHNRDVIARLQAERDEAHDAVVARTETAMRAQVRCIHGGSFPCTQCRANLAHNTSAVGFEQARRDLGEYLDADGTARNFAALSIDSTDVGAGWLSPEAVDAIRTDERARIVAYLRDKVDEIKTWHAVADAIERGE